MIHNRLSLLDHLKNHDYDNFSPFVYLETLLLTEFAYKPNQFLVKTGEKRKIPENKEMKTRSLLEISYSLPIVSSENENLCL